MKNCIKIGLVDTGINIENCCVISGYKGSYSEYTDFMNHGTICANIIHQITPNVPIYNVKIFDKKLMTSPLKIIDAIEWCMNNDIKLINLSLSVQELNCYYELKNICTEGYKKGVIFVAAADNLGRVCLPAYLDDVIGVGVANLSKEEYVYVDNQNVNLYANGLPFHNDNVHSIQQNSRHATSFAAARVSGIITNILLKQPNLDFAGIVSILKSSSLPLNEDKIIIKNKPFDFEHNTLPIKINTEIEIASRNKSVAFIGSESETVLLNSFSDLLKPEIQNLLELELNTDNTQKHIGTRQIPQIHLPVDYKSSIDKSDTVILGSIQSYLYDTIKDIALLGKKILTLQPLFNDEIGVNIEDVDKLNEHVVNLNTSADIVKQVSSISSKHILKNFAPILGIVNLSEQYSNIDIELFIRRELLKRKFKIGQISNNPIAVLFGIDYCYNTIQVPLNYNYGYAKALIESVNNINEYDLIIVSVKSPLCTKIVNDENFHEDTSITYVSFLQGFQPDKLILVINELDETEIVLRNINLFKCFFDVEISLIVYDSINRKIQQPYFSPFDFNQLRTISKNKYIKTKKDIEAFDPTIKVLNLSDEKEQELLIQSIIDYCKEE